MATAAACQQAYGSQNEEQAIHGDFLARLRARRWVVLGVIPFGGKVQGPHAEIRRSPSVFTGQVQ